MNLNTKNMILVTGASGHFGSTAIHTLLENGIPASQIKALVRTPAAAEPWHPLGIEVALGDYDDYASLIKAFTGVSKVLFVSSSDLGHRLSQHRNVVLAAKEVGVAHLIYTSFQRTTESSASPLWGVAESHLQTERWIEESGIPYTFLRNNLYLDFLPAFIGAEVLQTGVIFVPAGTGRISAVLRSEMAEAAAKIVLTAGHEGKVYSFSHTESVSYETIAQHLAALSGKSVVYVSPEVDVYAKTLAEFGVPAESIGIFSSFALAQASGELDAPSTDLATILGRPLTPILEYITNIYFPTQA